MAIFTPIADQMLVPRVIQISRLVRIVVLWVPAGYMTAQAFGIVMAFHPSSFSGVRKVAGRAIVRSPLTIHTIDPDVVLFIVAIVASFGTDKSVSGGMRPRFDIC